MKRWLGNGVGVLLMVASAIGVYNVVADNGEVERLAQEVACKSAAPGHAGPKPGRGDAACSAKKTMMERTPIAQTFQFATTSSAQVTVRCTRAALLVGDYACEQR